MLGEERRRKIVEQLQQGNRVIAKDLSEMFQVSIDSIRRDLTMLEEQGLLQKTYGGAVPAAPSPKVRTLPQPQSLRYGEGAPHQNAISKLAASYIEKNETVFIGGAGIQFGMLKYLPAELPFTVVTNSLKIAETLREKENIETYLIGGKVRHSAGSMIDAIAIEMIAKFNLDTCFLTGGGIAENGISTATPEGAGFTRAVCAISRRRVCLAPHEKVGVKMFTTAVPIEQMDIVITDQAALEKAIREIERRNVKVIFAEEIG
ncbi:DeoR/GlpR family DNA-binding transcription regulator [Paenibacillus alkalitolerans]|uniref:DeoR/GlpR family DNA-binding transcription regulator n=1 Tax=Paenibacillus alkalitolerans TaxID=2799335 RepID=UPI0018F2C149|nr:DeoR/GlpR family DNA-binding transcription regulator [Paenibacillus alkalitolerans]